MDTTTTTTTTTTNNIDIDDDDDDYENKSVDDMTFRDVFHDTFFEPWDDNREWQRVLEVKEKWSFRAFMIALLDHRRIKLRHTKDILPLLKHNITLPPLLRRQYNENVKPRLIEKTSRSARVSLSYFDHGGTLVKCEHYGTISALLTNTRCLQREEEILKRVENVDIFQLIKSRSEKTPLLQNNTTILLHNDTDTDEEDAVVEDANDQETWKRDVIVSDTMRLSEKIEAVTGKWALSILGAVLIITVSALIGYGSVKLIQLFIRYI